MRDGEYVLGSTSIVYSACSVCILRKGCSIVKNVVRCAILHMATLSDTLIFIV